MRGSLVFVHSILPSVTILLLFLFMAKTNAFSWQRRLSNRVILPPTTFVSSSSLLLLRATAENSSDNKNGEDSSKQQQQQQQAVVIDGIVIDWDWKKLSQDVFGGDDQRPIVLFDGVCNLCNGGVNFAIDQDENAKFRFCSLQSKVGQSLLLKAGKSPADNTSIVLATPQKTYFASEAVSRICMGLDAVPLQWFGTLGKVAPDWIRESIYSFVSKNRFKFGESDQCRLDFDGTYTSRFISDPTCNTYDIDVVVNVGEEEEDEEKKEQQQQ